MPAWPFTYSGGPPAPTVNVVGAVPTSGPTGTVIEANTMYLLGTCFTNTSGAPRTVTLMDAAGVIFYNAVDVPISGVPLKESFEMMPLAGMRWFADGSGVNGRAWGY